MQFSKRNRNELKQYFKKTLIPTEKQFEQLIDGLLNTADDGVIREEPNKPLSIQSDGVDATKNVLALYDKLTDEVPHWTLGLQHIGSPGLAISDRGGTNRLFIASSGNVGIGTAAPETKLHVDGDITLTGKLNAPLEWILLPLVNKWVQYAVNTDFGPPAYSKDALGIVRMRGLVANTTANPAPAPELIFTLPKEFWPEYHMIFNVMGGANQPVRLDLYTDGEMKADPAYKNWINLSTVTFEAKRQSKTL